MGLGEFGQLLCNLVTQNCLRITLLTRANTNNLRWLAVKGTLIYIRSLQILVGMGGGSLLFQLTVSRKVTNQRDSAY